MSCDLKRLGQILDSTFGLGFLAHLVGLTAWEIIAGQQPASSISKKAKSFIARDLKQPLIEIFAEFIREYPFGYTHDWTQLADELTAAKAELELVLFEVSRELTDIGFEAVFDHKKQFVVTPEISSSRDIDQITWKANADAWWTHPNTVPSFQGWSTAVKKFAFDDAVVLPNEMKNLTVDESQTIFCIGSAQDWQWLTNKYSVEVEVLHLDQWRIPSESRVEAVWVPDWVRVAKDFDGVYLSPAAYLSSSYSFRQLPDGRVTILSGWSPGATYWLPKATP